MAGDVPVPIIGELKHRAIDCVAAREPILHVGDLEAALMENLRQAQHEKRAGLLFPIGSSAK